MKPIREMSDAELQAEIVRYRDTRRTVLVELRRNLILQEMGKRVAEQIWKETA